MQATQAGAWPNAADILKVPSRIQTLIKPWYEFQLFSLEAADTSTAEKINERTKPLYLYLEVLLQAIVPMSCLGKLPYYLVTL